MQGVEIQELRVGDPLWPQLLRYYDDHEEGFRESIPGYDQRDSRVLVAMHAKTIVGILRLIIIPIGPNDGLPAVCLHGNELLQAKVMEFHVLESHRRRGIGTRLQEAAVEVARADSCYQLASYSDDGLTANHMLKLSMGFGVHPVTLGTQGRRGLQFIMPLAPNTLEPRSDRWSGDR